MNSNTEGYSLDVVRENSSHQKTAIKFHIEIFVSYDTQPRIRTLSKIT